MVFWSSSSLEASDGEVAWPPPRQKNMEKKAQFAWVETLTGRDMSQLQDCILPRWLPITFVFCLRLISVELNHFWKHFWYEKLWKVLISSVKITDIKARLTTLNLFLQLLYPRLVLCQLVSVSSSDVGHLLPLDILQSSQFMLVFVHLTTHLFSQILFQSGNNIKVRVSVSLWTLQAVVIYYWKPYSSKFWG